MNKITTDAHLHRRAMLRRRATAVRDERLAKLEKGLLDETLSKIESDLAMPLLCGPIPPLVATTATVLVPMLAVLTITALVPTASVAVLAPIGLGTAFGIIKLGARWWASREESRGLPFRDLMLWTWLRHRHAEKQLTANTKLLGLSSTGRPMSEVTLGPAERLAVLHRLNAALELKDAYTLGHSRRVATHAYRTALALGLPSRDINELTRAATLHDIGKLAVPDHILSKPGALSDRERDMINRHSAAGSEILGMLDDVAIVGIVRSHHERWDGRGYPDGLAGGEIPLGARIIAVADTYDAMTSARPYRAGSSRKHAIAVLRDEAGHQFDAEVVDAFVPTLRRSGLVAGVALALTLPRRLAARLTNTLKDTIPASAVSGTTVVGTALFLATSLATLIGPPEGTPSPAPVAVPRGEVEVADEVLGIRITRGPDLASKASRTKKGSTSKAATTRTKDGPKKAKEHRPPARGPRKDIAATTGGSATPTEDPAAAAAERTKAIDPPAPLDPRTEQGNDCTNDGNRGTQGGRLHCGA